MTDQLTSFETAKLAKEKGFKEECYNYIDEFNDNEGHSHLVFTYVGSYAGYRQPTQSLLQKWLREKHNIHVNVDCNAGGWYYELFKCNGTTIYIKEGKNKGMAYQDFNFSLYEEALEAGLFEALKLIQL